MIQTLATRISRFSLKGHLCVQGVMAIVAIAIGFGLVAAEHYGLIGS